MRYRRHGSCEARDHVSELPRHTVPDSRRGGCHPAVTADNGYSVAGFTRNPRPDFRRNAHSKGGRAVPVFEEEAKHFPRGVRPSRIGVGAGGTASRPSVSGAMDFPVLKHRPPARVGMDGAGKSMSSRRPTAMYFLLQLRSSSLRNDMVAVTRMHCVVLVPMKDDGRDVPPVSQNRGYVVGFYVRRHVRGSGTRV